MKIKIILLVVFSASLGGCSRLATVDQPQQSFWQEIGPGYSAGQSFTTASYQNGSQFILNPPQEAQSTFDLVYDNLFRFKGLIIEGITWIAWLLAGVLLFILPGWAIFHYVWPGWADLLPLEKAGVSGGMSLAIYPILILWTDLAGIHLGRLYAILPAGISLAWLVIYSIRTVKLNVPRSSPRSFRPADLARQSWESLVIFFIISLLLLTRLYAIRGLDAPLWGDSVHHTLIVQLILNNHGLFDTWAPFAELKSFTYHFGFHSLAAAFAWLTGINAPKSILVVGQFLNILAVLALYPLAVRIGRNRWAGIIAILIGGFMLSLPMGYLNWGRYTQLAGQVILPVAMLYSWVLLHDDRLRWSLISAGWAIFAAMALAHYRVALLGVFFYLSAFVFETRRPNLRLNLLKTAALGAGSLILFLPWIINIYGSRLYNIFSSQMSTPPSQNSEFIQQQSSALAGYLQYLPTLAWFGIIFVIAWGLWRREIWIKIISVWLVLIWFATNPAWLGLPGTGIVNNFTILIAAYIPASILIGGGCGWLIDQIKSSKIPQTRYFRSFGGAAVVVLIVVSVLSVSNRLNDIKASEYSLLTGADLRAFDWIKSNIPEKSRFLVNSFFAFGNTTIVGSDAGWWLPYFTGNLSNLPPMPYVFEKGPRPDYPKWINQLPAEIYEKGINHPDVQKLLQQRGIDYIYIGQQQGSVNSGDVKLDLHALQNNPAFEPIYHQDRVWIFKYLPNS